MVVKNPKPLAKRFLLLTNEAIRAKGLERRTTSKLQCSRHL